jgi:hypothetical protein
MTIKQYFQVKAGGAEPDPAVFCPLHNYKPAGYIPDPTYPVFADPGTEEIILSVSDRGDLHLAFSLGMKNSGTYQVTIYGANDAILIQQTKTNGSIFQWMIPMGLGYPSGYDTIYKVSIKQTVLANTISTFTVSTYAGYAWQSWK